MYLTTYTSGKDLRRLFEDSVIFHDHDREIASRPSTSGSVRPRNIKTFQDSNIFGWKDSTSASLTHQARQQIEESSERRVRDIPTFNRTNILEHSYNEELERIRDERKNYKKHYNSVSVDEREFARLSVRSSPNVAFAKKQQDLQGNHFENPNIVDRKVHKLQKVDKLHAANAKWNDTSTQRKFSNSKRINPECYVKYASARKNIEFHSDIFHQDKEVERNNISLDQSTQSMNRLADFSDKHNEDIRRKDQRYSDIFGSEHFIKNNEKFISTPVKKSLKFHATADWRDSKTEHLSRNSAKKNDLNAKEMKMRQLACTIHHDDDDDNNNDIKNNINNNENPMKRSNNGQKDSKQAKEQMKLANIVNEGQTKYERAKALITTGQTKYERAKLQGDTKPINQMRNNDDINAIVFDIRSQPKNLDEDGLRKLFAGYPIIELKPDMNKLNGKFLGSGIIKIRNDNKAKINELKNKLKLAGISLLNHYDRNQMKEF